ncbi:hypothetical protein [Butyrivibrio sp. VCB2006]|uniref:hypothetical protein n=1 Tax=Butyrivibrio sp. VCB2006 TaxID=1280679 RepID=UPI000425500A|nr:hypothetical protein [Butyrivibrio sp. VCB2006]
MKKKKLIAATMLLAITLSQVGCSNVFSDYIDDETASSIASLGKSFAVEKGTEMVSDIVENSTALISQMIEESKSPDDADSSDSVTGILSSTADIGLMDADGKDTNYIFTYGDVAFAAIHWDDHWKIIDSYLIENSSDMVIICQALIDVHPIHGADMENYRTADDMAYEWLQHNLAYEFLPEGNAWREKSKDVDFNPDDQGKTFIEIYEERTGKEFNFKEIMGK